METERWKEARKKAHTTHGGSKTRLFRIWQYMRKRCTNKNAINYERYGGRGITVCPEWQNDFAAFRDWAMANGYRDDLTIDRKDNNGPYSPENCKWSTVKEQGNNRRSTHLITYNGETHSIKGWSEKTGIAESTLWNRIHAGNSPEDALTRPVRRCEEAKHHA